MAVDPQKLPSPYGVLIREARKACEWRQLDAFNAYKAAGGAVEYRTFVKWDMGQGDPSVREFDIIAAVFNARLQELGRPEAMLRPIADGETGPTDGGEVVSLANAKTSSGRATKV